MDYLLNLRQGFIEHMQLSPVYLKMPISREKMPEQTIEKLVAQISGVKEKFDWKILPTELRPKVTARKIERKVIKNVDIVQRQVVRTIKHSLQNIFYLHQIRTARTTGKN